MKDVMTSKDRNYITLILVMILFFSALMDYLGSREINKLTIRVEELEVAAESQKKLYILVTNEIMKNARHIRQLNSTCYSLSDLVKQHSELIVEQVKHNHALPSDRQ